MTVYAVQPTFDAGFARRWVAHFAESIGGHADALADLDRRAGDGDFGTNLTSALRRADGFLVSDGPETFAAVFFAVSKGFLNTGGTSGPLFGMWFRELAKATVTEPVSLPDIAAGVANGLATIQRLAHADVGDNTMVDALAPAAAALRTAVGGRASALEAFDLAAEGAAAGAASTRDLVGGRGRASYVGELARGVLDPGAVAVALLFAAALTAAGGAPPDADPLTLR